MRGGAASTGATVIDGRRGGRNIAAAHMTTANKVTIVRILLVPVFLTEALTYVNGGGEMYRKLAIACFAVAAISDGIDGYIARRFNQRSQLGAILDPLADKLLLIAGTILLSLNNGTYLPHFPLWLAATILSRDLLLLIGLLVIQLVCGRVGVRPHFTGKIATVLQMATILWALFRWDAQWLLGLGYATALFTAISGLLYVRDGVRQLSASPHSLPTPGQ